ncbi:MAG: DUF6273 domain-containing protein [Eubacteriales bacterium]
MKNQFQITVENRAATVELPRPVLVAGSVNTYECIFSFDESWDGLARNAVFSTEEKCCGVPLDTANTCTVPWEILQTPGMTVRVGVFGTDGEGKTASPTLWGELGKVHDGARDALPGGEAPETFTSKIMNIMEDVKNSLKKADGICAETEKAAQAAKEASSFAKEASSSAASAAESEENARHAAETVTLGREMLLAFAGTPQNIAYACRLGMANKLFSLDDRFTLEREKSISASKGLSTGIESVSVDEEVWLMHGGTVGSGTYCFFYNGNVWLFGGKEVNLSDFGISVSGTPALYDEIIIKEIAETVEVRIADLDPDGHYVRLMPTCGIGSFEFDSPEALYYCENGLSAGTYYFTLPSGYDTDYSDGWEAFNFTLPEDVPAGGQLVINWWYKTHLKDALICAFDSAEAMSSSNYSYVNEGEAGTFLGKLFTWGRITGNINHIGRARYGCNNYEKSAVRQYLNSTAKKGSWWHQNGIFDRMPSYALNTHGFLHGVDAEVLGALSVQTYTTCVAHPTLGDGNGSVTLSDRVVLPARVEVYGGEEDADDPEGSPLGYFREKSTLSEPGRGADSGRIFEKDGKPCIVWLRSPEHGNESNVDVILASGALDHHYAGKNKYALTPIFQIGEAA